MSRLFKNSLRLSSRRRFCTERRIKVDERGLYDDVFPEKCAEEVRSLLKKPPQCAYAGFDPTAPSLHIGNLFVLTTLLRWQRNGHKVIALIGNATGQIGDPSHRTAERDKIDLETIFANCEGIRENLKTIFEHHEKFLCDEKVRARMKELTIVENLNWYKDANVIDFIRDVGKYFRMGTMIGRSSVQSRLNSETGMSFAEFSYALFQAYDWMKLCEMFDCRFQIGGSDQMGNIVSGHDLITRTSPKKVYGLTLPLITAEGGRKFSKSTGNAVWLSAKKSSSFQLYQFFFRTTDNEVEKFLRYFTFLDLAEIKFIVDEHKLRPEERKAQRILAEQVTLMVHGETGLETAKRVSAALYNSSLESISNLRPTDIVDTFDGAKTIELPAESGITIFELAMKAKCFKTEHDARRIITSGGFYINNNRVVNTEEVLVPGVHILSNNLTLLRTGKKTYHIVKWR